MRKIAVIPARGGSKRIPRKNIKPFFGKPIISYSLQSSTESGIFDQIHVSTEDQEIYDIVESLGHKPRFFRSAVNAKDHVSVKEVLKETIQEFEKQGESFDIICLLSATVPLITGNDLKRAYQKFEECSFQYPLLAVARYPVPTEWAMKLDGDEKSVVPVHKDLFFESSHNFKEKYYDIGSFVFFTKEQVYEDPEEIRFSPYVLPLSKSVDLDTPDDWEVLEKLYTAHKNP